MASRRARYLLNRLANAVEDGAERLVVWLRAKAERKHRPRPLVFPSALQIQMDAMFADMARRQAAQFVRDLQFFDGASDKGLKFRVDEGMVVINRIKKKPHADA